MGCYYPEGWLIDTPENQNALRTIAALGECLKSGRILEAKAAVCDGAHNLWVSLGPMRGLIPRQEGALGVAEGTTKDIAMLSRVGKPVCFVVQGFTTTAKGETVALLSRRAAQERCQKEFLSQLLPGDILPAQSHPSGSVWLLCRYWLRYLFSSSYRRNLGVPYLPSQRPF